MKEAVAQDWLAIVMEELEDVAPNDLADIKRKSLREQEKENITFESWSNAMILYALGNIDEEESYWTKVAAIFYKLTLYRKVANYRNMNENDHPIKIYSEFLTALKRGTEDGLYDPDILASYTEEELELAVTFIKSGRDNLFNYIGLRTLADRYLTREHDLSIIELPQERFLVIALKLMSKESPTKRMQLVGEAYWALSTLRMTVATPTFANAGKTHGQLSSCFIDTVEDSLESIYNNNSDMANVSKNGGGVGVYMGKIRARNAPIKGFKGASSGVN